MTEHAGNGATPDVYQIAQQQVQEIAALVPARGIPTEERARLNSEVRRLLPQASDLAVAQLMLRGHDLSRREFLRRLREQRITQLEAAFEVMESIAHTTLARSPLFMQAHAAAVRCAPTTSSERMVEIIDKAAGTAMERDDREVFADVLSVHPEMDEILRLYGERKAGIDWYTYWINIIKESAHQKRAAAL